MSDTRAFTYDILPEGSSSQEDGAVHQVSPSWVLTFINWENRDTSRNTTVDFLAVPEKPLVVENDCIQLTVSDGKGVLTPSLSATLLMTDVNYLTAVAPGDFVAANMLNWDSESRRIADNARARLPINGPDDGFKGMFKVQSVRRVVSVDPNTGVKIVLFKIEAFAFTEFNNSIYFNPYLIDKNKDPQNLLLFASYIGKDWTQMVNAKGLTNVQDILALLIQSFIGDGVTDLGRKEKNGLVKSPNVHFFIPEMVGNLLGTTGAKAAKDVYNFLFGIQHYSSSLSQSDAAGLNPSGLISKYDRFQYTKVPCGGDNLFQPEFWNQVKTWSVLNQYSNSPLNELYTCFRLSTNNRVMPTLVFRQIPFTTDDFGHSNIPTTRFMTLPRWRIDTALIFQQDIGRDEAARVNFVQYFGKSTVGVEGSSMAYETAQINYVYDVKDVQRSGLRPYVVTSQFDESTDAYKLFKSPDWAKVIGDSVIGGQLKLNGSVTTAGIVDPIAVGDNLELDDVVYHIEQIVHSAGISMTDGKRSFRTNIKLSSGVSIMSNSKTLDYAEMDNTSAYSERTRDFNNDKILPGVSESQDVVYRPNNVDGPVTPNKSFAQPDGSKPVGSGGKNG